MRLLRGRRRRGGASAGVLSCGPEPAVWGRPAPSWPRNSRPQPITRRSRGAIDHHSASPSVTSTQFFFPSSLQSSEPADVIQASSDFVFLNKAKKIKNALFICSNLHGEGYVTCLTINKVGLSINSVYISTKLRTTVGLRLGLRKKWLKCRRQS